MIKTEQKQAIIYCRVSDQKQNIRGDGLRSQERTCREFAAKNGLAIAQVFEDVLTGGRSDRPGLEEVKAYLRKNRGTILLVDHANRLSRDLLSYLLLRAEIEKLGGVPQSPVMEFKEDASSRLAEHVVASVSEYQRLHNKEQTTTRMKARAQNGWWVFQAPVGYRYKSAAGRGKMLVPDYPVADVVREALEGYASGRFENQADVMRWLQANPLFPKDRTGLVRNERVSVLLCQCLYAGYLEVPRWGISMRPAQHEPIISFETYKRIQDRIAGAAYAPRKKNVNKDFPLRGYVLCADCQTPLTACWSKGTHSKYPYYLCPKRGCESYGKSIRRDKIEGEFEGLLKSLTPSEALFRVAVRMFKELWDYRLSNAKGQAKALAAQLAKVEKQIGQYVERILDVSVPAVISAYETRIQKLEEDKLLIKEKMANVGHPKSGFDETLRTALAFLSNPWNLWVSGRLEDRKAVLKLAFAKRLEYKRNEGFRTANLSLPFKALTQVFGDKMEMARPKGFEPLTPRFVVWCSIQLSYGRAVPVR